MNKTLMERARSMLIGGGLGQEFWADAVEISCYLVNKSPSSVLEDKTPQEVWIGKKPSLSHLRWVVYSRDVLSREVKDVIKHEVKPKEPEKIEFELKEEESRNQKMKSCKLRVLEHQFEKEGIHKVDLEDGKILKEAMVDEMAYFHKNEAWDLVEFPAGMKPIGSKRVFKKKTNAEGKVEKYKVRLVAKGYS
eukprot:PITA_01612